MIVDTLLLFMIIWLTYNINVYIYTYQIQLR